MVVYAVLAPESVPPGEWYGKKEVLRPAQKHWLEQMLASFSRGFLTGTLAAPAFRLPLDASEIHYLGPKGESVPGLRAAVSFTLHNDGRVSHVQLDDSSNLAALDSAVLRTVAALESDRALAEVADSVVRVLGGTDSVRMTLAVQYDAPKTIPLVPLGSVRAPVYDVTPALAAPGAPTPKYPEELRDQFIEGEVLVQFRVDPAGRLDMGTLKFLRFTDYAFAKAVLAVMPQFRFSVPTINGCPAQQVVQLPFAFLLRR